MAQSYLVSGSSRGIGLELVRILANRPETIVFAGVRNPSKAGELQKIVAEHSNVHIIKLDSISAPDAKAAAETVEKAAGGLDVVIANATRVIRDPPCMVLAIVAMRRDRSLADKWVSCDQFAGTDTASMCSAASGTE